MKIEIYNKNRSIQEIVGEWEDLTNFYGFSYFHSPTHFNFYFPIVNKLKYTAHFLVARETSGKLRSVLPVFKRRFSKKLLFFNGEDNELILDRADSESVLSAYQDFFNRENFYIYSNFVYEDSYLKKLYERCGWELEAWDTTYVTDLSSGFDAYLLRHQSKTRKNLKYYEAKLKSLGVWRTWIVAKEAEFEMGFQEFVRLNQTRWKDKAVSLNAPESVNYVRKMAKHLFTHGKLFLHFFQLNGENISVYFGINDRGVLYYVQAGREMEYERYSLGKLHMLEIFKWCCENGIQKFDFLPYVNPLKEVFSTDTTTIYRNSNQ